MADFLIIKTGALGDVLRTTSILPGLVRRERKVNLTWITAPAAKDLVAHHPLIDRLLTVDPSDPIAMDHLQKTLAKESFDWLISLDDEAALCALASAIPCQRLSGAMLDDAARASYSEDVAAWFGMGLLAKDGKRKADARKLSNRRSHPEILADMLGLPMGRPELPLPRASRDFAREFFSALKLPEGQLLLGLNTGAGGRWPSKELPIERVVQTAELIHEGLEGKVSFLVLGGMEEQERNLAIMHGMRASGAGLRAVDAGCEHSILNFAAIIADCDLLLSSDSLAMHLAIAAETPIVVFFAPTSAAEIELYGLGEKVISRAADYCSYRPDADNSSITAGRLSDAILRVLDRL